MSYTTNQVNKHRETGVIKYIKGVNMSVRELKGDIADWNSHYLPMQI